MLVVEVDSNLRVPDELTKIQLSAKRPGKDPQELPFSLVGQQYGLPIRVGLLAVEDHRGEQVEIVATAIRGEEMVVSESAILSLLDGRSMILRLFLARECVARACQATETCSRGGVCRAKQRAASELEAFTASAPREGIDAGGLPIDAPADSPPTLVPDAPADLTMTPVDLPQPPDMPLPPDARPLPQDVLTVDTQAPDTSPPPPPIDITTGLLFNIRFDEGAGSTATDISGRGHHATLEGTATWTQPGRSGSGAALYLSGPLSSNSPRARIAHHPDFAAVSDRLTAMAWIRRALVSEVDGTAAIVTSTDGAAEGFRLFITSDGRPGFVPFTSPWREMGGPNQIPVGRWTHVAGTYDGTSVRVYVDGDPVLSYAAQGPISRSTVPISIGRWNYPRAPFNGAIDEVRHYNRALSREEICAAGGLPCAPQAPPRPTLVVVDTPQSPRPGDGALRDRLVARGFNAVLADDDTVALADANAARLVIISSSIISAPFGAKLAGTTAPVLCMDATIFGEMGMTGALMGTDFGFTGMQPAQITILDALHPLAAGLSGTVTVSTATTSLSWGRPGPSAAAVAREAGGHVVIFAYPMGAAMVGRTAPARRVGFFAHHGVAAALTSDGLKLFDAAVDWALSTSPPVAPAGGLRAEYFDNSDLTALKLTRVDATVNFDWGLGSPDPSIDVETFSVRWTGKVTPRYSETYTFITNTDDGVRLWVNNVLLLDLWLAQASTDRPAAPIVLNAGQAYDIRMEYFEAMMAASAKLSWSSPSQPREIVPAGALTPAP